MHVQYPTSYLGQAILHFSQPGALGITSRPEHNVQFLSSQTPRLNQRSQEVFFYKAEWRGVIGQQTFGDGGIGKNEEDGKEGTGSSGRIKGD
jgi:hypothetical protein